MIDDDETDMSTTRGYLCNMMGKEKEKIPA
jgi:hypothetical protein